MGKVRSRKAHTSVVYEKTDVCNSRNTVDEVKSATLKVLYMYFVVINTYRDSRGSLVPRPSFFLPRKKWPGNGATHGHVY